MLGVEFLLFFLLLLMELSVSSSTFSPPTTSSTFSHFTPPKDCRDKLGMSDPNKIKTSQIRTEVKGDEDKVRLIEGNDPLEIIAPDSKADYWIQVDLLEIHNITGIIFFGWTASGSHVILYISYGGKTETSSHRYPNFYKSEINDDTFVLADEEIQEYYFRPVIETRHFKIDINAANGNKIYFQFELLGCKPNVTTTVIPETTETSPSTEVTTPVQLKCNDKLNYTLHDMEFVDWTSAKVKSIDFDPPGLYQVESVTVTLDKAHLTMNGICDHIEVYWFLEYERDSTCVENYDSVFYYVNEDDKLCNKMTFYIYDYENIDYSLEIIGCLNQSWSTYTPTLTTRASTSPSSLTTATSPTTVTTTLSPETTETSPSTEVTSPENCTSRPTFQIPANYFQIDNCTNLDPIVNLHECVGECNTYSSYPENGTTKYKKTCQCCTPYEYNPINVNLYCYENKTNVLYTIEEPSKCECT